MKLVIAKPSPFARKARVALLEKGIAFETEIDVPWNPGAAASKLNPLGKIPILVLDDGRVIHDSKVIVEYLETLGRPPQLLPSDPALRLAHKQIEATADGVCEAVVLIVLERSRAPALQSSDWIARQLRKVAAGTNALANELGPRQWFVGSAFGLADIAVGCMLGYLDLRLPELDWRSRHANLVAFAESVFARPSFAATLPQTQQITQVQ
jgi:glutathione S-transferase